MGLKVGDSFHCPMDNTNYVITSDNTIKACGTEKHGQFLQDNPDWKQYYSNPDKGEIREPSNAPPQRYVVPGEPGSGASGASGTGAASGAPATGVYSAEINAAAKEFGVPPELLAAQMHQESGGNPNALGDGGKSFGLMQLQKDTWDSFRNSDKCPPSLKNVDFEQVKNDPATNIRAAAALDKSYHDQAGGGDDKHAWGVALRIYNSGSIQDPSNLSNPADGATTDYVQNIFKSINWQV
ncbi:transglycosylase SLT domain-containing protein [Janthinobacterium agaricidamnosum]|nr:transglycosylase SLT domain-containing protein [Janthinobacterium agaricidamnosum]